MPLMRVSTDADSAQVAPLHARFRVVHERLRGARSRHPKVGRARRARLRRLSRAGRPRHLTHQHGLRCKAPAGGGAAQEVGSTPQDSGSTLRSRPEDPLANRREPAGSGQRNGAGASSTPPRPTPPAQVCLRLALLQACASLREAVRNPHAHPASAAPTPESSAGRQAARRSAAGLADQHRHSGRGDAVHQAFGEKGLNPLAAIEVETAHALCSQCTRRAAGGR